MQEEDLVEALPTVSIVIPVLNDATGLGRCLASIRANRYPTDRLEILVGDNGSIDGSDKVAASFGAVVVRLPGLTVAAVRNRLAAMASGDVLALVDADHELAPDWIRSAAAVLRQPTVAAVGAAYHSPPQATWVQHLYDAFRSHNNQPCEARWLGTGNLAIRRQTFVEVGGFDTSLTACEDVDLCHRIRALGHRLVADERLRSVHYGDPATLRQLFACELWRGRDNLAVSLRGPISVRDLPGVVIPIVVLSALLALPLAAIAAIFQVPVPLVLALCLVGAPSLARALALLRRLGEVQPVRIVQAVLVASVYDMARALALIIRKPHRRAC